MLIPIRTDYRQERRPLVNYVLVALNVAIFLLQQQLGGTQGPIRPYLLDPDAPELMQFFSSIFLHGGWAHIIGNMIFLWVFGNAVNDRLGHVAYLAFYLGAGVLAGVGYVLLAGHAPVLGASGAIAGVTGCYLVLFPRVRVTVVMWLYVLVPLEIPSLYFLGMQFVFNLWLSMTMADSGVAYVAHASGYVYGIGVAAILLALRLLPRDVYDLLSLWKAGRRRAGYRRMVAQGYDPFSPRVGKPARSAENVRWGKPARAVQPSVDPAVQALRTAIAEAHGRSDLAAAAAKYLDLVALVGGAVLPRPQQLDVSNYLMTEQRYAQAADAYQRFLKHYPNYEHVADIRLMLGIIYGRYLQQADKAQENLRLALAGLHDAGKVAMANAELEALGRKGR